MRMRPWLVLGFALSVSGCKWKNTEPLQVTYLPAADAQLAGTVAVAPLAYAPREAYEPYEPLPPNIVTHIDWNAPSVDMGVPFGSFIADALRIELAQAGVNVRPGRCTLSGEVKKNWINVIYDPAEGTYHSEVRYVLTGANGTSLYDRVKTTEIKSSAYLFTRVFEKAVDNLSKHHAEKRRWLRPQNEPPPNLQRTSKGITSEGISNSVAANIDALLSDPDFKNALSLNCQ